MKKVEVYFLINLGAILSIFAIEGELGEYMRRQNDILLEVAKDKLESIALALPILLFSSLILLYTDSGGVTLLSSKPSIL